MTQLITFFNHKGGVGKTTQLYHLAWMLTKHNKRVLMVDADSQCNLSYLSLGEDAFIEHYKSHPLANIKSGLSVAFESRPKVIEPIDCPMVGNNDKLFLLPGSFDLTDYETQLSVAINFNTTFLTMANLPGSFYALIKQCAESKQADYVLIDLNPGLSAINQTLISSSNYFIIPCGVDYFSLQAVISLSKVLPKWAEWSIKAKTHFMDSVYPLPSVTAKFLGYTINNFNTKNKKLAKAVQNVIDEIDTKIKNDLLPALSKTNSLAKVLDGNYCIAQIKNFNTLQQISHMVNKPVFNLTADDTKNVGTVADTQEEGIEQINTVFEQYANYILNYTSDGDQ